MYLKSIEVQGFKSFANKIVFEFHNGITGIVGPNGSGKSNVGDAVRWVLGEQSAKQLRGSNMQDVIFSGTENRKPLGYASVAITLDNSDHKLAIEFEEVTITRKVYRSGESEYRINGSSCRLKDVQELFYDTGIGKEGYSIIGQGQIERILSGRPEERRELFDEAAGIVKFKKRKKAAQKNLENERANLVRINDILSELEKQVGPLEKQAEQARTYLKKKEELKCYDVNKFLMDVTEVKKRLQDNEQKESIVNADLEETQEQYEKTKAEYERLQSQAGTVEDQMDQVRNALGQASVQSQRLEGEINVLREQIHSTEDAVHRIKDRRQTVQEELDGRIQEQSLLKKEQAALEEQLSSMKQENSQSQDRLVQVQRGIQEDNGRIENAKNRIIELLNEKAATQGRKQRYDTMLEQVQIRRAQLNQKLLSLKTSESEQEFEITDCETELKELSERLAQMQKQEQQLREEEARLQHDFRKNADQQQELVRSFHKEQSRLDSLINLTERYDGYGNAIRRVMEHKKTNAGIIGVVADILKVEQKYEVAVETALGGSIQNIVVDTEQTAKQMIELLKKNHLGRATFLPLNSVQARDGLKKEILHETGALGAADTIVSAQTQYRGLLSYLLGRTLVVDTMDHAIAIARKYRHSLRIVTLEGELLNPGGSMTGGAFKNSSNLLGRRREMEELQEKVTAIRRQAEQHKQQAEAMQEQLSKNHEAQQELSGQLQTVYLQQNTAKINWNQAKEKKADLVKEYQSLKKESEEMENQIQNIGYQKKQIHEEVLLFQNQVEELNGLIDEWQIHLLEAQRLEQELNSELSEKQIGQAGLQQKRDNTRQNIRRLSEEKSKLLQELEGLRAENEEVRAESEQKEAQIVKLQDEYRAAEEEKKTKKEKLSQLSAQKESLAVDNKEFLDRREKLLERKNDLDKEQARLESRREKLEEEQEASVNYIWEEYELTYNMAVPLKDERYTDSAVLKQKIRQVREELRALGTVNVNAIEDYKTISERYEFLSTQRSDLLEAEKTLINIIEELDEGMRRQFAEKFAEIRKEFDYVFKELFGGGKGSLELDEEVDILEAGIRINSQPPGKKLGNMMQLSGGEKALTAIALLFAIQNLKPSPFCLLDEIEAALDDSNVTRFARYLHKLTKYTQFIIITHRRGTMAAADRLYGITMQEKGVSALVSVNLIEEELD